MKPAHVLTHWESGVAIVKPLKLKPAVRIGIVAVLLIAIAPLYVVLPFRGNDQNIGEFAASIAIWLVFTTILFLLWDAVQAIGRKRLLIPFGLALVTFAAILVLYAFEPDAQRATAGFYGLQADYIYRPYYDLVGLVFIVILYAGTIEVLRHYTHKIKWRDFIAVGFLIFVLWVAMGGFTSRFNTFEPVLLAAIFEGSLQIPRAQKDEELEILGPTLRY
jgi:hypothetical protein